MRFFADNWHTYSQGVNWKCPLKKSMRLFPRPSDSSVYQGGLFNEQELVWLNLCSRLYMHVLHRLISNGLLDWIKETNIWLHRTSNVSMFKNIKYHWHVWSYLLQYGRDKQPTLLSTESQICIITKTSFIIFRMKYNT